jgi:peptide/nickel transport system substrate-binding protein
MAPSTTGSLPAASIALTEIDMRRSACSCATSKLAEDVARPVIHYQRAGTCWYPYVKGLVLHQNSIYNGARFEDVWLDK